MQEEGVGSPACFPPFVSPVAVPSIASCRFVPNITPAATNLHTNTNTQANKGSFPNMFFFETPAEHPKDKNGQTCSPMTGYNYVQSGTLDIRPDRIQVEGWNSGLTANNAAADIMGR